RRSSTAIHEAATKRAVRWGWAPPDPRARVAVELSSGDTGDVGDVVVVGQGLPSKGLATEEAPPPFNQIEPRRPNGNEGLGDARVVWQPVANGTTEVTGQVVGDKVQVAVGIGVVNGLQERKVARGVACGRRLSQHLPRAHAQRPVDPDLLASAVLAQRRLDAV